METSCATSFGSVEQPQGRAGSPNASKHVGVTRSQLDDEAQGRQDRPRSRLYRLARPPYRLARKVVATVVFDWRHGVRTEDPITLDALGVASPDRIDYEPSGRLMLRRSLPRREVSERDVFLDAGAGMGRVVLQAAMLYPFRRVVGVELSAELHAIAAKNVAQNRGSLRCPDVTLVHADVLDVQIPDDVTVVYLFNPFVGEVFEGFTQRLLDSIERRPRDVRIIYVNPREESTLLATGRIRHVRSVRGRCPIRIYVATPS